MKGTKGLMNLAINYFSKLLSHIWNRLLISPVSLQMRPAILNTPGNNHEISEHLDTFSQGAFN